MSSWRDRAAWPMLAGVLVVATLIAIVVAVGAGVRAGPTRILLVGDSITQGSAGDYTWRYRLWTHLRQTGASVDFVGPRDDLFDNVAQSFGSHEYADPAFDQDHAARWGATLARARKLVRAQVERYEPDVVVVLLGTNDLAWRKDTPDEVAAGLRDFVRRARLGRPGVDVVLVRLTGETLPGVTELNVRVERVAASMSRPASRVAVAAADRGFSDLEDTWGPFHPNAQGELKIAAAVADALSAVGVGAAHTRPLPDLPLGPRTAPTLAGASGDGQANLTWSLSPGATAYYVWVRDTTTGQLWTRMPIPLQGSSWVAGGLQNGHTYQFRLQPEKGRWASADVRSNTVTVTPQPAAPGS